MSDIKNEIYTESDRAFTGVHIPPELWLNTVLSWTEKIILLEIKNLDKKDTHCFASNAYIAKFAQCSETSVKSAIQLFKAYGIIQIVSYDGRKRVMTVLDGWEHLLNDIDAERSRIKPRTYIKKLSESQNSTFSEKDKNRLSESQNSTNININNINNSNELLYNNEEKEKEINKENFSGSETTRNTMIDVSLKEVERITPTPIRDTCLLHIRNFTTDVEIQNLLIDYLDSRLQQTNNNLTEVSFKAALGTLKAAQQYCEVPSLLFEYTKEVILNATAGAYSQFKAVQANRYRKLYHTTETQHRIKSAPFGDCSKCIPIDGDLELATDENGNPLKF